MCRLPSREFARDDDGARPANRAYAVDRTVRTLSVLRCIPMPSRLTSRRVFLRGKTLNIGLHIRARKRTKLRLRKIVGMKRESLARIFAEFICASDGYERFDFFLHFSSIRRLSHFRFSHSRSNRHGSLRLGNAEPSRHCFGAEP